MNKVLKNILKTTICLLITVSVIVTATYSWFVLRDRAAQTDYIDISNPPVLYILDSNAEDSTVVNLEGLAVGTTYKLIFCISSVYDVDDEATGAVRNFQFEIAHTNNMHANFRVYPAQYAGTSQPQAIQGHNVFKSDSRYFYCSQTPLTYSDVSSVTNSQTYAVTDDVQARNEATYELYSYDAVAAPTLFFDDTDSTQYSDQLYDISKFRFFQLEIYWDSQPSDIDAKETDLVYIIASGIN